MAVADISIHPRRARPTRRPRSSKVDPFIPCPRRHIELGDHDDWVPIPRSTGLWTPPSMRCRRFRLHPRACADFSCRPAQNVASQPRPGVLSARDFRGEDPAQTGLPGQATRSRQPLVNQENHAAQAWCLGARRIYFGNFIKVPGEDPESFLARVPADDLPIASTSLLCIWA